jgi:hypothetical protein
MEPSVTKTTLVCPRGDGQGSLPLQMATIRQIDALRIQTEDLNERNVVRLRARFIEGCREVRNLRLITRRNLNQAKARLTTRRKVVLVDESKALLKAAGHEKSSEDLRKAIVDADPEVLKIEDLIEKITIVDKLLEIQLDTFRDSYFSCMKWDPPKIGEPPGLLTHTLGDEARRALEVVHQDEQQGWEGPAAGKSDLASQFGG